MPDVITFTACRVTFALPDASTPDRSSVELVIVRPETAAVPDVRT